MAIMQSYKKRKACRTTKATNVAKGTIAIQLFPVAEYDYSPIARKAHAGYLFFISQHYKMQVLSNENLVTPDQRVYVNELYEYVVFDTELKTPLIDTIEGLGIVDAAIKAQAKCSISTHLVSISLAPLKID